MTRIGIIWVCGLLCALCTSVTTLAEGEIRSRNTIEQRQAAQKRIAAHEPVGEATKEERGYHHAAAKTPTMLSRDAKAASTAKTDGAAALACVEAFAPANDNCVDQAIISGPGPFAFNNTDATDEGGPDHARCEFFWDATIIRDVWYCWTAPQTALYKAATCGQTSIDSKIAVYKGCTCPPTDANLLACNDDACGFEYQSDVTFEAQASQQYLIRLGTPTGFGAAGGPGTFTITESDLPCEISTSEHCQAPDQFRARESNRDYATVAEDFTPATDAEFTKVCWWGVYADPAFDADCQGAGPDTFVIRYYSDGGGKPGSLLAEFTQASGALRVTGPVATGNERIDAYLANGDFVDWMREYEYSATHAPVQVAANECYWIEISNSVASWCFWAWEQSPAGDNRVIWDVDGVDPPTYETYDIVPDDQAFCLGLEMGAVGASCDVPSFCADGFGDCCTDNSASGAVGCNTLTCCERVCTCDNFCCEIVWDDLCAGGGICGAQTLCSTLCSPVTLTTSKPLDQGTLWRSQKNITRLTFDGDLRSTPAPGEIEINEMLPGGVFGADLSASFTIDVEGGTVLRLQDTGATLEHRKWYAIRNIGGWGAVNDFEIQYLLQMGDADENGIVISLDVGAVNSGIPCFVNCGDDNRLDIDGDGRIISLDVGVVNGHIGSFSVPKPDGH